MSEIIVVAVDIVFTGILTAAIGQETVYYLLADLQKLCQCFLVILEREIGSKRVNLKKIEIEISIRILN